MYPSQTEDSANFGIREQKNPVAWKFSGKKPNQTGLCFSADFSLSWG